jgi:hypothetical protein
MSAIPQDVALRLQLAAFAGNEPAGSYLEVRYRLGDRPGMGREFFKVRELEHAATSALQHGAQTDTYVSACPRVERRGTADAVTHGWCAWADVDSRESVQRLRGFRPTPSIIIRSGSDGHLHVYWPLRDPVLPVAIRRANLRLALTLRTDPKVASVAEVLRAAGTLNFKHTPPATVECIRLELDTFRLPEVVGGLEDTPFHIRPPRSARAFDTGPTSAVDGVVRFVLAAEPNRDRNTRLNWAAYTLGPRVAEGSLSRGEVESALYQAAIAIGLSEDETLRTIKSGLDAGMRR